MKDKLKRIKENVYELPRQEKMNVPARVFISEAMLEKVEENAIEQLHNVACLKGIKQWALAMPDTHSGYGFPIGGVAAFDKKEGVISPGGVGYDINCLVGDARILTEFGSTQAIEEFEVFPNELEMIQHQQIVRKIKYDVCLSTLNLPLKKIEPKPISYFMY